MKLNQHQRRSVVSLIAVLLIYINTQRIHNAVVINYYESNPVLSVDRITNKNEKQHMNENQNYHGIKTYNVTIDGNKFYGPFASPNYTSKNKSEILIVFPIFNPRNIDNDYYCHFFLQKGGEMVSTKANFDKGAMFCPMPIDCIAACPDDKYISTKLTNGKYYDSSKAHTVQVATWPFWEYIRQQRSKEKKYEVIQTSMIKNLNCNYYNDTKGNFCIRDWLEWHIMIGVDHFVLYDNGSDKDAPHLTILRPYVLNKIVTLIDWPYVLGGCGADNCRAQNVALNHAVYAFSSRTKWMGFFDVDEFFFPRKPFSSETTNTETLPSISSIFSEKNYKATAWTINTQTMTHPDHCLNPYSSTTIDDLNLNLYPNIITLSSRLALCTHRARLKSSDDTPKMFVRFGNHPFSITSPHRLGGGIWLDKKEPYDAHFMHFANKYGCMDSKDSRCEDETIVLQNGIHALIQLEQRLL